MDKSYDSIDISMEDFLEHFGVKGMKWGVRRQNKVVGTDGGVAVTKGDTKWKKQISKTKAYLEVHNQVAGAMNRDLPAFNKKYEGKNIGYDAATGEYKTAIGKQYLKEYEALATRHAEKAVSDIFGSSPSGNWTTKAHYSLDYGLSVSIEPTQVSHSISETENGYIVTIAVALDDNGFFQPIKKETESSMAQSEVDGILHFGVKGMQWGVRRSNISKSRGAKDAATRNKRKKAAAARRTLTDKDIDSIIARLEKEKKLKSLVDEDVSPGKVFANSVMSNAGRTILTTAVTGVGVYAIRAAMQKNFNLKEAADYLKPKKK